MIILLKNMCLLFFTVNIQLNSKYVVILVRIERINSSQLKTIWNDL